jgi:Ca2+-binding EF-hand superfamily protein
MRPQAWPATLFLALRSAVAALILLVSCDRPKTPIGSDEAREPIERYDTNKDGALSETEKAEMNEAFVKRFDQNNDGKLGPEERAAIRKQGRVTVTAASNAPETLKDAESFIRRLDRNADGVLVGGEVEASRWKVVSLADADGDGKVTAEEWLTRVVR